MELAEHRINEDLQSVAHWCSSNRLLLNANKTVAICIGHDRVLQTARRPRLLLNGVEIAYVDCARNLGVEFDSGLSFKPHIDVVVQTATQRLANLGRARHLMPARLLKQTVSALVLSAAFYGIAVWSACSNAQLQRVQRLQNWAARIVSYRRKFDPVSDVIEQLGWLRVDELAKQRLACAAYRALKGELGEPLAANFTRVEHRYGTRHRETGAFAVPVAYTDRSQRRFGVAAPAVLNEFQDAVERGAGNAAFATAIKRTIIGSRA